MIIARMPCRPASAADRPPARLAGFGVQCSLVFVLCSCGGDSGVVDHAPTAASAEVVSTAGSGLATRPGENPPLLGRRSDASTPDPEFHAGREFELLLLKDVHSRGAEMQHRDSDTLAPVRGLGYPTIYASVQATGKHRSSQLGSLRASCMSMIRCEYPLPSGYELGHALTVRLSDGSLARMSATRDLVAIAANQLSFDDAVTVIVTLSTPGQPDVQRKITYSAPDR
jgi:hypothetical protein